MLDINYYYLYYFFYCIHLLSLFYFLGLDLEQVRDKGRYKQ